MADSDWKFIEVADWKVVTTEEIQRKFPKGETYSLEGDDKLHIGIDTEMNHILNYAMTVFHSSKADGSNETRRQIFHGSGVITLREMRHTWFGEGQGYVFYLPSKSVIKALEILTRYFD